MKGIVFAAGIGSRLKPFTDSHPKALAMIGERSLLEIVIDRMVSAGVDSIVVNAHHFAEQIFSFVRNRSFGVPVEISDESALLLDTAGAIAKIERDTSLLKNVPDNEPVLIHNSDILTDFPISEMLGQHVASQADATLLVDPQRTSTRGFLFDSSGRLCAWHNSTTGDTIPEGTDISTLNQAAFGGYTSCGQRLSVLSHIPCLRDSSRLESLPSMPATQHNSTSGDSLPLYHISGSISELPRNLKMPAGASTNKPDDITYRPIYPAKLHKHKTPR